MRVFHIIEEKDKMPLIMKVDLRKKYRILPFGGHMHCAMWCGRLTTQLPTLPGPSTCWSNGFDGSRTRTSPRTATRPCSRYFYFYLLFIYFINCLFIYSFIFGLDLKTNTCVVLDAEHRN